MKRALPIISLLYCLLFPCEQVLAADSWLMPGHDAGASNDNPAARFSPATIARLHRVWSAPGVTQVVAADRYVYTVVTRFSGGFDVQVLSARTGVAVRSITSRRLDVAATDTALSIAYGRGRLLVATQHAIIGLDPFTGGVDWRVAFGSQRLLIDRGTVYTSGVCSAGCTRSISAALELRSGRVIWKHRGDLGAVSIVAGNLYQSASSATGGTRVFDASSGSPIASLKVGARWLGAGSDAFAQSVAPLPGTSWIGEIGPSGKPLWRTNIGRVGDLASPPAYALRTLYTASNRFHPGIVAINAANGHIRWARDLGQGLSFVIGGRILFVSGGDAFLHVLDAETGHSLRQLPLPNSASGGLMVAGSTIYVVTRAQLVAIRG